MGSYEQGSVFFPSDRVALLTTQESPHSQLVKLSLAFLVDVGCLQPVRLNVFLASCTMYNKHALALFHLLSFFPFSCFR